MKIIFDYNRTLFDPDVDTLYPGVLDLLNVASQKHEIFLVSRNERARKKRMKDLGIEQYFKEIFFVDEKSDALFVFIAGGMRGMVVGDSIQDEIAIGNRLGLITVRLKQGKFAYETPQNKSEIPAFEVENIEALKALIAKYE